jgi:hypothetical protein
VFNDEIFGFLYITSSSLTDAYQEPVDPVSLMNVDKVEHTENSGMSLRVCFINTYLAISIDNFDAHCNVAMDPVSFTNAFRDHSQCLTMKIFGFFF